MGVEWIDMYSAWFDISIALLCHVVWIIVICLLARRLMRRGFSFTIVLGICAMLGMLFSFAGSTASRWILDKRLDYFQSDSIASGVLVSVTERADRTRYEIITPMTPTPDEPNLTVVRHPFQWITPLWGLEAVSGVPFAIFFCWLVTRRHRKRLRLGLCLK